MPGDSDQAISGVPAPDESAGTRSLLGGAFGGFLMGALFYAVIVPAGLIMRASGRDPLRLRRDPGAVSYWVRRERRGPPPGTMKSQF